MPPFSVLLGLFRLRGLRLLRFVCGSQGDGMLMTRGYLEPAVCTQENNEIAAEAEALTAEKEHLMTDVNGSLHKADAMNDLIRFVAHVQPSPEFDGALFERFIDHATLRTRNEIVFHLKCGLNLTERVGEK